MFYFQGRTYVHHEVLIGGTAVYSGWNIDDIVIPGIEQNVTRPADLQCDYLVNINNLLSMPGVWGEPRPVWKVSRWVFKWANFSSGTRSPFTQYREDVVDIDGAVFSKITGTERRAWIGTITP